MPVQRIRDRIFGVLELTADDDLPSKLIAIFITTLILLNVIAVIIETVEPISRTGSSFFHAFEVISVTVFTIEYVLRLWTCTSNSRFKSPIRGRIRYTLTPLAIVDLLAILPFYLPMIIPLDLRFMRALRLFRIIRLFKVARYSESLRVIGNVFKKKREELAITIFMVVILLVVVSSLMYFIENEAQPKAFSNIPMAMWWGVVTLTTVGYGDVYPVTPIGKLLGAVIALLGIGMIALPTGILGAGFVEEIHSRREARRICPHCGKDIDEPVERSSDKR